MNSDAGLYTYSQVASDDQIREILILQKANLKMALSTEIIESEGFVTCDHDFELLSKMNQPNPHVVALYDDRVIGYCLVMLPKWRRELEVLISMFEKIESLHWNNHQITPIDYVTMGQVCIHKDHRGQGVFRKMYAHYKQQISPYYKYCITEVATSNTRSRNAHEAIGFQPLHSYIAPDDHSWELIIWDWNK